MSRVCQHLIKAVVSNRLLTIATIITAGKPVNYTHNTWLTAIYFIQAMMMPTQMTLPKGITTEC